jgi:signal transduction histidine kinase
MIDTRGGFCWSDGTQIEEQSSSFRREHRGGPPPSHGDHGEPPPPPPPNDHHDMPPPPDGDQREPRPPPPIRDALEELCRAQLPGVTSLRDVRDRGDVTSIAVRAIRPGFSAFAMRIVPGDANNRRWPPALGVIALATLLVIGLNLHGLWTLRRGAAQLGAALTRLEADPRADIEPPATRELADVAIGVRGLARRLADAQAHELELERGSAHQKRMSSLGYLVAGIAHEVRNPLTGIKLLLDGIRRREADAKTRTDVDTALREIARLDKLVAACLGVARDTAIERTQVDLGVLVDERIGALAGHANARAITLDRRGASTRLADRDAVVRIVDNLVRNAIDASPDGGAVTVVIDAATLDVIDRGPGVPDAQAATLFEPFVTSKPDGTGLGLWMSLALAEARGGTVRYRRTDDMTHFTLDLEPV